MTKNYSTIMVRYFNTETLEGIRVRDEAGRVVREVVGLRRHQYGWTPTDDRMAKKARKVLEMERVFGRCPDVYKVPGAYFGEIVDGAWFRHPGELDIVRHIIKRA